MKRSRSVRQRVLIVAAIGFAGLAGAVALAGPAAAGQADPQPTEAPGVPVVTEDFTCGQLRIIVTNPPDGAQVTVTITTSRGDTRTGEIGPGEEFVATFSAVRSLTYEVTVDGELLSEGGWDRCDENDDEFPSPEITSRSECDSITIVVRNIRSGPLARVELVVGDVEETVEVPLGETIEVTFPAERGTVVGIGTGRTVDQVEWVEPEGCDGGGGGLPVTGVPAGIVAGTAVALLATGAGLFLVARRRRITFST